MQKRCVQVEDLGRLRVGGDPQISSDGARIAFTVRTMDVGKNKYGTQVWVVDGAGEAPARPWTAGGSDATHPRWLPDGKSLLFVSSREEKKGQIFLLPVDGGEAERLTDLPAGSIGDVRPAPDGGSVAFTFRPADAEERDEAKDERKKKNLSTPVRVITRPLYRAEGTGFVPEEPFRLYVLDLLDAGADKTPLAPLPLPSGRDIKGFCWGPDSGRIAFVQNVADEPDLMPNADALFVVDAEGKTEPVRLNAPLGPKSRPAWSPDGKYIAYLGHDKPDEMWGVRNYHPWVVPVEGEGAARDLVPESDTAFGVLTTGGSAGSGESGPHWDSDSAFVWVLATEGGAVSLQAVALDGHVDALIHGAEAVTGVCASGGGIALLRAAAEDAGDIYTISEGGELARRTTLNAALFAELSLGKTEAFEAAAPDGKPAPCFALFPPDFGENPGPRPTILYVHGGPHLMYTPIFSHEFQCLAAAGYVVLFPNPRGSQGYGEEWTGAIRGDWGDPAMADALACVDYAIEKGWADENRLAMAGGSYGGYLTLWTVGKTARFRCAVPERGVYNLQSMAGTCDFAWRDDYSYFRANATSDPGEYLRNSPLTYVENIQTPLLLVHSEGDLRCPIEQAEQVYAALKRLGRDVTFVRYGPETNHELSRSGPPDLRLDRLHRLRAFFDLHLKEGKGNK